MRFAFLIPPQIMNTSIKVRWYCDLNEMEAYFLFPVVECRTLENVQVFERESE